MTEEQEKTTTVEEVSAELTEAGNEFPDNEALSQSMVSQADIDEWKAQNPHCKFAFFIHVDDPYVYRSFTMRDVKELEAARSAKEQQTGKKVTDDEYLEMFCERYVLKPAGMGEKIHNCEVAAGIPHLLYDLINHLSGFADVEPVIL